MFLVTFPFSCINLSFSPHRCRAGRIHSDFSAASYKLLFGKCNILPGYMHTVCGIFFVVWLYAQRVNKMKNCTSKVEIILTFRHYLLYNILSIILFYSYTKILINTFNGNVTMSLLLWYIVKSGFEYDRTFVCVFLIFQSNHYYNMYLQKIKLCLLKLYVYRLFVF